MRYVSPTFQEATLRRGKSLEQFLGGVTVDGESHIAWVELRPASSGIEVWKFVVPDLGDENTVDCYEFGGVDDSVLLSTLHTPAEAIEFAARVLGATSDHWANEAVIQDDYLDFMRSGRVLQWCAPGI